MEIGTDFFTNGMVTSMVLPPEHHTETGIKKKNSIGLYKPNESFLLYPE